MTSTAAVYTIAGANTRTIMLYNSTFCGRANITKAPGVVTQVIWCAVDLKDLTVFALFEARKSHRAVVEHNEQALEGRIEGDTNH